MKAALMVEKRVVTLVVMQVWRWGGMEAEMMGWSTGALKDMMMVR